MGLGKNNKEKRVMFALAHGYHSYSNCSVEKKWETLCHSVNEE